MNIIITVLHTILFQKFSGIYFLNVYTFLQDLNLSHSAFQSLLPLIDTHIDYDIFYTLENTRSFNKRATHFNVSFHFLKLINTLVVQVDLQRFRPEFRAFHSIMR